MSDFNGKPVSTLRNGWLGVKGHERMTPYDPNSTRAHNERVHPIEHKLEAAVKIAAARNGA